MELPLKYHLRNAARRWRSTVATLLGIALVVFVYVAMQAMAAGIAGFGANTGDPRNLLVTRRGATAEGTSQIALEQFRILRYAAEIARDPAGEPLVSADLSTVINIPRITGEGNANAVVRGVSPRGRELRPQVRLVAGRWFVPGKGEVVASLRMAKRFANLGLGQSFVATAGQTLTVVGHFDGAKSAFDSELWMDADEARSLFDRANYSSILLRPADESAARAFAARLDADKRLRLRAVPETEYYTKQAGGADTFKVLGQFLAAVMSVGAVFAAMNTLYAAVGARTREVGTLRVLGFRPRSILLGFMVEGVLLALAGGAAGCGLAAAFAHFLAASGYSFGTFSPARFSETVFEMRVTAELIGKGLAFSLIVGVIGSFLPANRAARLPVITALRAN